MPLPQEELSEPLIQSQLVRTPAKREHLVAERAAVAPPTTSASLEEMDIVPTETPPASVLLLRT
jgi:hypothetical protein